VDWETNRTVGLERKAASKEAMDRTLANRLVPARTGQAMAARNRLRKPKASP
jgi:hypothetical protein